MQHGLFRAGHELDLTLKFINNILRLNCSSCQVKQHDVDKTNGVPFLSRELLSKTFLSKPPFLEFLFSAGEALQRAKTNKALMKLMKLMKQKLMKLMSRSGHELHLRSKFINDILRLNYSSFNATCEVNRDSGRMNVVPFLSRKLGIVEKHFS